MINSIIQEVGQALININIILCLKYTTPGLEIVRTLYQEKPGKEINKLMENIN